MKLVYKHKRRFISNMVKTIFLSILSQEYLEKKLTDKLKLFLRFECYINYTMSGRSALSLLFWNFNENGNVECVLLPEYTCNVIYKASEWSKLNIKYYKVEDNYMPNWDEISNLILDNPKACVVLTSYFNREIDYFNAIKRIKDIEKKTYIIFDECQNLLNIKRFCELPKNTYIISSFNNKMTYGLLGGIVISNEKLNKSILKECRYKTQIDLRFTYIKYSIKYLISVIRKKYSTPFKKEISQCIGKYSVVPYNISKLSLSCAMIAVNNTNALEQILINNYNVIKKLHEYGLINVQNISNTNYMTYYLTEFNMTNNFSDLKKKAPYGNTPSKQQRPGCLVVPNNLLLKVLDK